MKAREATSWRKGSRASCQGRAQNLKFTIIWGHPLNPGGILGKCENLAIYYVLATLRPQKHPKMQTLGTLGPTMSAIALSSTSLDPDWVRKADILLTNCSGKQHLEALDSSMPAQIEIVWTQTGPAKLIFCGQADILRTKPIGRTIQNIESNKA